jgi:hypothetical protein
VGTKAAASAATMVPIIDFLNIEISPLTDFEFVFPVRLRASNKLTLGDHI